MRNTLDQETYNWLFKIFTFFGIMLAIITGFLFFVDLGELQPKILKVSIFLLLILASATLWIRIEYLKLHNFKFYKTAKIPFYVSAILAVAAGFFILV